MWGNIYQPGVVRCVCWDFVDKSAPSAARQNVFCCVSMALAAAMLMTVTH